MKNVIQSIFSYGLWSGLTSWPGCLEWISDWLSAIKHLSKKEWKYRLTVEPSRLLHMDRMKGITTCGEKQQFIVKPCQPTNLIFLLMFCLHKKKLILMNSQKVGLSLSAGIFHIFSMCIVSLGVIQRLSIQGILWAHLSPTSKEKRVSCQTC